MRPFYRLTNIQAALGCAQMERLDEFVGIKRQIAARYTEALEKVLGITSMKEAPWVYSTFWLYTVLVDKECFGMDSRALLKKLANVGIQTRPLWRPVHKSPAHLGAVTNDSAIAEFLNHDALSIPCSSVIQNVDQKRITDAIRDLCGRS